MITIKQLSLKYSKNIEFNYIELEFKAIEHNFATFKYNR